MKWKIGRLLFLSGILVMLYFLPVQTAAAMGNDGLIDVQVQIHIEKPDYFWQYPFGGKKLDNLLISGMGKSYTVYDGSAGDTFTFAVPKGYTLRLGITFPDSVNYNKTIYFSKRKVTEKDHLLAITLKAPEYQDVFFQAPDFDEKTVQ